MARKQCHNTYYYVVADTFYDIYKFLFGVYVFLEIGIQIPSKINRSCSACSVFHLKSIGFECGRRFGAVQKM